MITNPRAVALKAQQNPNIMNALQQDRCSASWDNGRMSGIYET